MRLYKDKDVDPSVIAGRSLAVIGYGSQGSAFAHNLRDSGFDVSVSLDEKSASVTRAAEDGFPVISNEDAYLADILLMMLPDHMHGWFFDTFLSGRLKHGQSLVFAHAYSIHFGLIKPPKGVRCALVAPHGPGKDLRSAFVSGSGISCFVASSPAGSRISLKIALAIAKACGCTRVGAFKTTFESEAIGDLFGEQALLCGGLVHLMTAAFDILVKNGIPPENAYLETAHQLELLAGLIRNSGVTGMFEQISRTAQFGTVISENSIANAKLLSELQKLYDDIASGTFSRRWMAESEEDYPKIKEFLKRTRSSRLEKTSKKVRELIDGHE